MRTYWRLLKNWVVKTWSVVISILDLCYVYLNLNPFVRKSLPIIKSFSCQVGAGFRIFSNFNNFASFSPARS